MRLSLDSRGWAFAEAAAVGVLLAAPPLVLRTSLSQGQPVSIVLPAIILAWSLLTILYTSLSPNVRLLSIPIGLGGSAILWLIFVIVSGATGQLLLIHAGTALIFAILSMILGSSSDYRFDPMTWASLGFIGGALVLHWWGLRYVEGPGATLHTSLWITIASAISIRTADWLTRDLKSHDFVRFTAWALLVSLAFLAPLLWLYDWQDVSMTMAWTGLAVAIVACLAVGFLGFRVEGKIPETLAARPRIVQTQLKRGNAFLEQRQFRSAMQAFEEALAAWEFQPSWEPFLVDKHEEIVRKKLFYAAMMYADELMQAGDSRTAGVIGKVITRFLSDQFLHDDLDRRKIALKLLLEAGRSEALFEKEQLLKTRQVLWQTLVQPDPELRKLVRKAIKSAAPVSLPVLVDGFHRQSDPSIQLQILQLLHELNKTELLFMSAPSFPNLYRAWQSSNPRTHSLADSIILAAGEKATVFFLEGLDREDRSVRQFAMQRLIELDKFESAIRYMARHLADLEPKILLTLLQARLLPDPRDPQVSLGEQLAQLGHPHGLDVLADLKEPLVNREMLAAAWKSIEAVLRDQLFAVLWAERLDDARQAARIYSRDPGFIPSAIQMLQAEDFDEKYYTANLVARVLFLLMDELPPEKAGMLDLKQDISIEEVDRDSTPVKVQLRGSSKRLPLLSIPVVYLEPGNPMLLLVNNESYRLAVQIRPSANPPARLKFFARANAVDIPQYAKDVRSVQQGSPALLEFHLLPNKTKGFEDRLTVTMQINGRWQRLMAYKLFVCDPRVLEGLAAESEAQV